MWIKTSGALSDNVFQLGTAVSSHILVVGDASALIDTSITSTADRLCEELESSLGEDGALDLIFITHAHFDHVGGLPVIRAKYPDVEVIGAPATAELLGDAEYLDGIYKKNLSAAEAMNAELGFDEAAWKAAVKIDRIIGDGDAVDLGDDVELKLIASPGHTADSVSYLIMPDAALAAGESVGSYGGRDIVANCFTDNFNQYLESLDRLSGLDLKILSFPHSGAITGELVPRFFMAARQNAESFRDVVKERMGQGELVEEVFAALLGDWQAQNISPEGPFVEEQQEALKSMIRAAAAA